MAFMKGAPGCCCCKLIYFGDITSGRMLNLAKFDTPNLRWERLPSNGFAISGYYHYDHYHKLIFDTPGTSIRSYNPKFTTLVADMVYTTVLSIGGSQVCVALATVSEESKVIYVLRDSTPTTSRYVREVGFDGTGDAALFTLTLNTSAELVTRIDHCRADDRIYFVATTASNSVRKLRACDRDGSNNVEIFDPGSGIAVQSNNSIAFDNVL